MLGDLLAGGVSGLLKGAQGLIREFHMSPEDKAKLQIELMRVEHEVDTAQIRVNTQEAMHPNWKVAGWRPYIGWVCGTALLYQTLLQPMLNWGMNAANVGFVPPVLDTTLLTTVLLGMLGLGSIRAYEKVKKVARG